MSEIVIGRVTDILLEAARYRGMLEWANQQLKNLIEDRARLQERYIEEVNRVDELEAKLKDAQKLYYSAKQKITSTVKERNRLVYMLEEAKNILNEQQFNIQENTRERLNLLTYPIGVIGSEKLETILELNSTDDLMSELSYTKDEDDLLGSEENTPKRSLTLKRVPCWISSNENVCASPTKMSKVNSENQNSDNIDHRVIATTTVTIPQNGPVLASSVIETVPPPSSCVSSTVVSQHPINTPVIPVDTNSGTTSSEEAGVQKVLSCQTNLKSHIWSPKSHIMGEICVVCSKKIKFTLIAFKCSNCRLVVHTNCKETVFSPCTPTKITPNVKKTGKKHKTGFIEDFVPPTSPMVPNIVVQCIREIESKGLKEVGLYRVPSSEKEVKSLKEKLLKAKMKDLSGLHDVNTLCCCLKDFFRSLKETLIPQTKWKELAYATEVLTGEEKKNKMLNIIQSLPQANRDTLSYLILHLQKVASSPFCKMPIINLSKMFGPILIGYSNCESEYMLIEANISNKIMSEFLLLPSDCYEELLYGSNCENQIPELVKTPSQSSLYEFFSDFTSSAKTFRRGQKFFNSP